MSFTNILSEVRTAMPSAQALSRNDAVQAILTDIPLFAAGLLALGMFSFIVIMHHVSWPSACLHTSAFAAFIAGILDLSQVLLRSGVKADPVAHWNTVEGLITTREIFLALSIGLRFGFLWFFVSLPPLGENGSKSGSMHSACWEKWGILGMLLKWALTLLCVAVPLLQILYRTVDALGNFGPVYEVECTVEIVISACFILKLILNGYLLVISSPRGSLRWKPCLAYVPVVLALCINATLGAGNMMSFLWSETILGRLLQAIEYYILIVTISVWAFYSIQDQSANRARPVVNRSSSFRGLGPVDHSTFRISHAPFTDPQGSQREKQQSHSRRGSMADRLSSFLVPRALSRHTQFPASPTADKLWNQDEAERGVSPSVYSAGGSPDIRTPRPSLDADPSEPKESAKWQDPLFSAVVGRTSPPPEEVLIIATLQPTASLSTLRIPRRVFSSTSPSSHADSPVYGLDGRTIADRSPVDEPSILESNRSSSYSTILRQQAELDKSIASLKLLGRDTLDGTTIAEEGGKPSSASQSEFSLSNFPEPPWRTSTDTDYTVRATVSPVVTISRAESVVSQKALTNLDLMPPRMHIVMEHNRNISVPFSDNDDPLPTGRIRVDSEGTRYEITSFIGEMTHKKNDSNAVADAYYVLSDSTRRKEYDVLYSTRNKREKTNEPDASTNFFSSFASMFGGGGATNAQGAADRPDAEGVFADVFEELLRPEVQRHAPWWAWTGAVCGAGIGFIVANVPGLMVGAYAGNRLGAVRDAKGKSVAAVFSDLGGTQKAEILRALAVKVLGSAAGAI
ncbi:hypothetical protein EUX98_g7595 [Antrodiella citrinella]|uniref:J domain-containing protein n=1 Tax=Antrodiella citrinella TaxID=2447956 RepID=A0A4S4MLF7_9APHY|nr:hypothetical protein EUX98_g7595 [Antrodiella citrinella]